MGRIKIDSRKIENEDVFIAINKGVYFVEDALRRGASRCVVNLKDKDKVPSELLDKVEFVGDTVDYLGELARNKRAKFSGTVIGITGSAGKTTFKEMLGFFLKKNGFKVNMSFGNYNNQIGMPISILDADISSDFWILEMAISKEGDMDYLLSISDVDIGFITSIYPSHLEGLRDISVVCKEKAKIVNSSKMGFIPVRFFYKLYEYISGDVKWASEFIDSSFPLEGGQFWDLLGLIRLFWEMYDLGDWIDWKDFIFPKGRFFVESMGSKIIVDDSYNANPGSMKASLSSLKQIFPNKKIALILGDMLELGDGEIHYHSDIIAFVRFLFPQAGVVLIGERFLEASSREEFIPSFASCDWHKKEDDIFSCIADADVWFFKGSNGMKLFELMKILVDMWERAHN